ncbi:MAG: methylenetetrahydrofolate reductase C-terminal domain-containing protein [Candidatus Thermoplasmatota archaeon]|jgi:ferredoxin|nr:methylenetetrahydrofolate reductase C-terminal domain-containing protein [Candidatus Thermoplasmatota archaeon]MDP7264752.1 methylenetetrahydrofolate reductase C-terminal domain-containing protein [Candidatus Thermoplasmatota archaeon]
MIIGQRKPIDEIMGILEENKKILVLGCGTCVTVCSAGGEKEVGILSSALRMKSQIENVEITFDENTIERQCEKEFVDAIKKEIEDHDAVLSMACGVGVQTIADMFPHKMILPALNTTFMGMPKEQGIWVENCRACGNCRLHLTGGICPVTRCSKNLLNGPCGGTTSEGKCEVDKDIDCGWYLVYYRLKEQDKLSIFEEIQPPNDWRAAGHKGPRKIIREDLVIEREGDA